MRAASGSALPPYVEGEDGILRLAQPPDPANVGFAEEHFAELAATERNHFWHRHRREFIARVLARRVPGWEHLPFLEVGAGTCDVASYLREAFGARMIAAEPSETALRHARGRVDFPLVRADVCDLRLHEAVDLVGAFDVLEHVDRDEEALREIHRALRPGGHLVATVPAFPWLYNDADRLSQHRRRYTRQVLRARIERSGFEVLYATYFMTASFPFYLLANLWGRLRPPATVADVGALHRRASRAGRLLFALLRPESALAGRARLPFGSSLLVLARKPPAREGASSPLPILEVRARYPRGPYFSLALRLKAAALTQTPLLDLLDRGTVVDVGCGYGLATLLVACARPDLRVLGVDPDARRIRVASEAARGLERVSFRVGDARTFELPPCRTVLFADVLHHLRPADQDAALRAAARALEPGGAIVVFEVDPERRPRLACWLSHAWDIALYPFGVRAQFRTRAQLAAAAERAGLALESALPIASHLGAPSLYVLRKPAAGSS